VEIDPILNDKCWGIEKKGVPAKKLSSLNTGSAKLGRKRMRYRGRGKKRKKKNNRVWNEQLIATEAGREDLCGRPNGGGRGKKIHVLLRRDRWEGKPPTKQMPGNAVVAKGSVLTTPQTEGGKGGN